MSRSVSFGLPAVVLAGFIAGCTPNYSPNTYAATATQQANKVERAVVIGFREVHISTNGTVGAVTGGAAGGVLGSQANAFGINSALGAVGGTAIGSLLGTSIEHVTGDTKGWEYIVRKPDGELLSVTQKEERPLAVGQKVLVITGSQARIVADYATEPEPSPASAAKDASKGNDQPKAEDKPMADEKPKADDKIEAQDIPAPASEAVPVQEPVAQDAPAPAVSAPAAPAGQASPPPVSLVPPPAVPPADAATAPDPKPPPT